MNDADTRRIWEGIMLRASFRYLPALVVALSMFTAGCGASRPAVSAELELTSARVPRSHATCAGFTGQLHGDSSCASYDRALGAVRTLGERVLPGPATSRVECGTDLRLTTGRLHVDCTKVDDRIRVAVIVLEDRFHPEFEGTKHVLGAATGRYDYVNVLVRDRGDAVDFTVDYGLLD